MSNNRALTLARSIGPLAEANVLAVRGDILLEAGRYEEAEAANRAADLAAGGRRTPALERIEITRAELASQRGRHAEAFVAYARFLTQAEVDGDHEYIEITVECLVRALARAGRSRAMLEVAGVAEAFRDERVAQGGPHAFVFDEVDPAIAAARQELDGEADDLLAAGRAVAPAARVKRVCALLFADERS